MITIIKAVAGAWTRDEPKRMLGELNKTFGLPPGTIKDASTLYPTIPSTHLTTCTMDKSYFGKLPIDKQAHLVALSFVMVKAKQQQSQKNFSTPINDGDCHYGDSNYRPLNSFKTT